MDRLEEKIKARQRRKEKFKKRSKKRKQLLNMEEWQLNFKSEKEFIEWIEETVVRYAEFCPCSCWMCGNPRKHFKEKTKQELIFEEIYQEEIKDVDV